MESYTGKIEDGAMIDAPVYQAHKRGKNWMATIEANPAAPGGLAREFVKTGRGRYYYIVDPGVVGKAVEFGADYYSGSGNRSPKRWYGVVRSVTDSEINIEQYATAEEAIRESRVGSVRTSLEAERARLLARVAEIDALLGVE